MTLRYGWESLRSYPFPEVYWADLLPLLFDRFPDMKLSDPEDVLFRGCGFCGPINLTVTLNEGPDLSRGLNWMFR